MKTIILVAGKARSGKDYISNKIIEELNSNECIAVKAAFADELKRNICTLLNISLDELNELKNSEEPFCKNGTTVRQMLQRFGTDIVRKFDELHWVKILAKFINETDYKYYFISDFRYPSEKEISKFIKDNYKIITVNIISNNIKIKSNDHSSETSLSDYKFDMVIDNTDYTKKDYLNILKYLN